MAVDGDNARRAHQQRAGDGELSDRPGTENRYDIAALNIGQLGAEPGGRKDIADQNGLIVAHLRRHFYQRIRGERDARLFRLQAVDRAGGFRSAEETGARFRAVGIGVIALGGIAFAAGRTVAAGDGGADDYPIADIEVRTLSPSASTIPTPS